MNSAKQSLVLRVGGEAGKGIATAADLLCFIALKLGYNVFSSKDYASQIKGGHNYHNVRISSAKVRADVEDVDILLALDETTVLRHKEKVVSGGIIIYDDTVKLKDTDNSRKYLPLPLKEIENKLQEKNIHNSVFVGAVAKILGFKFEILTEVFENYFTEKLQLKEKMLKAAKAGYDCANKMISLEEPVKSKTALLSLLSGNDAVSSAALKAGIKFHAQYPMTPVSGILHNLAKEAAKKGNLTVIQAEDEISVINMALGASYAGARAMTATSGGGFALMVESIGLASMAEIPIVIIEGQRPGPSTGLPTKQEQGDLNFVLHAGTGDFPTIVIAPGDVSECYSEVKRAFYLSEKYQLPVIVLIDKYLAESFESININDAEKEFAFDFSKRINILEKPSKKQLNADGLFKRYAQNNYFRTLPGTKGGIFTSAGDEHDEVGGITEDSAIRIKMMERRMGKLKDIEEELPPPKIYGPKNAEVTVVSWGSNKGAIIEAVDRLNAQGKSFNFLQLKYLKPFKPAENILEKSKKLVLIENNYSAQLGGLLREKTGIQIKNKILRYDGSNFTVDEIYAQLKKVK